MLASIGTSPQTPELATKDGVVSSHDAAHALLSVAPWDSFPRAGPFPGAPSRRILRAAPDEDTFNCRQFSKLHLEQNHPHSLDAKLVRI